MSNDIFLILSGAAAIAGMVYIARNEAKSTPKPSKQVQKKGKKVKTKPKTIGLHENHIYDCKFEGDVRRVILRKFLLDGKVKVQTCIDGSEHTVTIDKLTPA